MFRRLIVAAFLLAVPTGAALGQEEDTGQWAVGAMPNGCMAQSVSPKGTMLSIWALAGDDKLGFLIQNRGWSSLRDGASYDLKLDFLGVRSLPVEATAKREIDSDGPGLFFTLAPGGTAGAGFLEALSSATALRVGPEGKADTLPLAGSRGAMAALARCLAERYAEGGGVEPAEVEPKPGATSI